jgi:hypothetical protein
LTDGRPQKVRPFWFLGQNYLDYFIQDPAVTVHVPARKAGGIPSLVYGWKFETLRVAFSFHPDRPWGEAIIMAL